MLCELSPRLFNFWLLLLSCYRFCQLALVDHEQLLPLQPGQTVYAGTHLTAA